MQEQSPFDLPSNLVIKRDTGPKTDEPTGEAVSLAGKFDIREMGSLAQREKPKKLTAPTDDKAEQQKQQIKKMKKQQQVFDPKKKQKIHIPSGHNILNIDIQENILYKPKTKENRIVYEAIIAKIYKFLGEESEETIKSTTDEFLAICQNANLTNLDKKQECEALVGKITDDEFGDILNLSKSLTDYGLDFETQKNSDKYDEEMRIGVVFEEDQMNEEESDDENVKDKDSDEEDEEEESSEEEVNDESVLQIKKNDGGIYDQLNIKDKYEIDAQQIDAYWLEIEINKYLNDQVVSKQMSMDLFKILNLESDLEVENQLVLLLNYDKYDLIKLLLKNRWKIYYCTLLRKSENQAEKDSIINEMKKSAQGELVLEELNRVHKQQSENQIKNIQQEAAGIRNKSTDNDILLADEFQIQKNIDLQEDDIQKYNKKIIELDNLQFTQGSHFMSNEKCQLPPGSYKLSKKGYDEIYVPAVKTQVKDSSIVKFSTLPQWIQPAFPKHVKENNLNPIQSKVYKQAFDSPENLLICAPTGAGKTVIALMTIFQGQIDLKKFKIVYIAPMKALVSEIVGNFRERLSCFNITVQELTGDHQLSKQQIQETQIIVATPEKWDIITRKAGEKCFTELVKLLIIDEIHLLHDVRGAVLEALVSRTIRMVEQTQEMIRIVGLSATLPNYSDVANFLRVDLKKGLFFFDASFRPVPLEQQFIGVTEKKSVKKMLLVNEILYEKIIERVEKGHQIIVFVHSRKETAKTGHAIKEMAMTKNEGNKFVREDSDTKAILEQEVENAQNLDLKELLPFGLAIHHAGLNRLDRNLVEELFFDGQVQVLFSTATLAWGVNLPAHTVIIKGTQIYSPEQGKWVELSGQDVLQMIGRAGRPNLDTKGEGIIITGYQELKYYLSLLNQQLPIESQFVSQLPDQLNAEIIMGSIQNIRDAVTWLGYTYLYVRMMRNPTLYSITEQEKQDDPYLIKFRTNLIHSAAIQLDKANLIKYDRRTGYFQSTYLGKISSHYYIKHPSMKIYNSHLKPNMGIIELFKLFSLSHEFKYIPIRDEEKVELNTLIESVPLPIKGSNQDPTTKVNVLLQAYISNLKLNGFALNADMVYIHQNANRLFRGIFEICLKRGWASIAQIALNACKMVDKKMWSCMTPLRQFPGIPEEIYRRIERKEQITWENLYNMNAKQIGDHVKYAKIGNALHKLIHSFPRIELSIAVQPITRSCLRVDLTIIPDFQWNVKYHTHSEPFWIIVEDCEGENILYSEFFTLKDKYTSEREYIFEFTVPLFEPLHPIYYVKVISDRWLSCEAMQGVTFKNLILPEKFSPPNELLDRQLLPISALKWSHGQKMFEQLGIQKFNGIQTQVFSSFYNQDENLFLGISTGSGKTTCSLLAILRSFKQAPKEKVIYIAPVEALCRQTFLLWKNIFPLIDKKIAILTGQQSVDLKLLQQNDIIITYPDYWDVLSRNWRKRQKLFSLINLIIVDEIHLLGQRGSTLEVITSRMRQMATQLEKERQIRIIALATSIANYRDIAEWIGAPPKSTFNFHPNVRPVPLDISVQGFDQAHRQSRNLTMQKHMYLQVKQHIRDKSCMIFVSDRKQARIAALELLTQTMSDNKNKAFLKIDEKDIKPFIQKISEKNLQHVLAYGIGFLYEGMDEKDKEITEQLFDAGAIQILFVTYKLCWEIQCKACSVIIMGTERYNGQEKMYVDYSIPDLLQMMGKAQDPKFENQNAKCIVLCYNPKKDYYKKFLFEPFPVESHLNHCLFDHLNAEVLAKTIENKQDCVDWLTWTFMYRRLTQNPNYYNLQEISGTYINDYLSELIETVIEELELAKCVSVEEDLYLFSSNLGIIASYYYISYETVANFAQSVTQSSNLGILLDTLSGAIEFQNIEIRHREDQLLKNLVSEINYKLEAPKFNEPNTKTNILLQCHFERTILPPDFYYDQKLILEKAIQLIYALVDVISSNCWLKPAILAMKLCQMVVQATKIKNSPLLQLPYITEEMADKFQEEQIEDIADFMNMDDDKRKEILQMEDDKILEIASFCNRYPTINMEFQVKDEGTVEQEDQIKVQVILQREDDEDYTPFVQAQYYPKLKEEQWWLVIGDSKENKLYTIKKFVFEKQIKQTLVFDAPTEIGSHNLNLYLICDSYLGCDQQESFKINVVKSTDNENEDE